MAYYEQQCSPKKREVYAAMYKGFQTVDASIRVPLLPMEAISDVYTRLRLDHPEIFYLNGFQIRCMPGADYGDLVPEYLFSKDKILTHQKAIAARAERLIRDVKQKSEDEKLRFLYQFIVDNVRYDKLKKPYSHEVIGTLTQGVGVCEGIAKSVKLLADRMGMECVVALSAAEEGQRYGHAWNVVKRSGTWYHLDATFDLSLSGCGQSRWDYFLLPDVQIYRDHVKPVYPVPECSDNTAFYYRVQKVSFTKTEDLEKRIGQAAKKKKPYFVFHWRGGYLTRDVMADLMKLIFRAAEAGGKHARVSLNWQQSVFCVQLTDAAAPEEITMESAREQEKEAADQE